MTLSFVFINIPGHRNGNLEWLLGEIITNVYVGSCRYYRGEKLAAYKCVQSDAFNLFIELVAMSQAADETVCKDIYSKVRRFEQRYRGMEPILARFPT